MFFARTSNDSRRFLQAAYFELYGSPTCVYESVLTKAFSHGRTEAGRSCTPEAVEFLQSYFAREPAELLVHKLRVAAKAHTKMTSEAAKGMGVDRHLYALECLARKMNGKTHPLFMDEGWKRLNESILSTSNCGNPSLRFFGFGPVCPMGFGVGYIIKDDFIHFMITSRRRQTERFKVELSRALGHMHDTLLATCPVQPMQRVLLRVFRKNSLDEDDGDATVAAAYDFFGLETVPRRAMTPIGRKLEG